MAAGEESNWFIVLDVEIDGNGEGRAVTQVRALSLLFDEIGDDRGGPHAMGTSGVAR